MWTVAKVSPSVLPSRSYLLAEATPMSPSAVFSVERPRDNSVVVLMVAGMAMATNGRLKCIAPCAHPVGKTHRYRSSHETGDQCTAATVTPESVPQIAKER